MKKALLFLLPSLILFFNGIEAGAYYVNIPDKEQENNPNVDVFKPESGVKIKASPLAQMMEDATRNATQSSKYKQPQSEKKQYKQYKNSWF